ncbi:hypothetical protein FJTKL_00808 [Diaporthe vaccinii]|uniref:Uncharacterized protein n=1 Tax=Diaporthe vaccinii TaxID=105482 RepID=A0ABR4E2D8_9PEZI
MSDRGSRSGSHGSRGSPLSPLFGMPFVSPSPGGSPRSPYGSPASGPRASPLPASAYGTPAPVNPYAASSPASNIVAPAPAPQVAPAPQGPLQPLFGTLRFEPGPTPSSRIVILPTGHFLNRTFVDSIAINADERAVVARHSHDMRILCDINMRPSEVIGHIIRRPSYFHAMLIQSRGQDGGRCTKCAQGDPNTRRFEGCYRIPGFQGGACAGCV